MYVNQRSESRLVHACWHAGIQYARMIERMCNEALYANDSNGALPRNLARKPERFLYDVRTGPSDYARDESEAQSLRRTKHATRERELVQQRCIAHETRQSRQRADIRCEPYVHFFDAEGRVGRR